MIKKLFLLVIVFQVQAHSQTIFQNAQVLDVNKLRVLNGFDIWVKDGKIEAVKRHTDKNIPANYQLKNCTGQFIVPGLGDAHVHFFQSGSLFARPDAIDLRKYRPYQQEINWTHQHFTDLLSRYLAAGITKVIDVGATYRFLKKRDSVGSVVSLADVKMTGPLLTTYLPSVFKNMGEDAPFVEMTTEEQARELVREQAKRNADFIKIWYIVTDQDIEKGAKKNLPLIQAVISEAHLLNKRVAVHATERITAQLAVEAGADFLVHSVDNEIIDAAFIQLLKNHKVVLSPTLVVAENYNRVLGDYYHFSKEELALAHPETVATIFDYPWPDTTLAKTFIKYVTNATAKQRQHKTDSIAMVNLKLLADAGVTIATGTDAGNIGTQHASSYFIELDAMKKAGLSNWQVLQASTVNVAKAVGQEANWGSIDVGKEANFLLLAKNPLDTLSALSSTQQIIHQGIAINADTLIKQTPELLVQQQLNAYNAHDLEAFLQPYSDSVEIYELNGKLLSKGKEQMRKDYQFLTQTPNLYCKLVNRMVMGNTVVDYEEIWLTKKPKNLLYGIAIYEIEQGKIQRVTFKQ